MQSLNETEWDVVISGTGIQQSLLALALSRSNKKVLHVDQNEYYGSAEAAFSLQEVEEWVTKVNAGNTSEPFCNASITKSTNDEDTSSEFEKLSFSRAYTLALSPQIIYSRSKLLSQLVSSQVYRQLEFQAVGSWWIYEIETSINGNEPVVKTGGLKRIPSGREDVFSDDSIDVRAKRSLMKFLKFVVDYEGQADVWQSHAGNSLPAFLSTVFSLPTLLQTMILALTLSVKLPAEITVRYSLPRIARHLTSMGVFGPGFAAVIPKWGGSSEISQVACRAGAVGGGVYILGSGLKTTTQITGQNEVTLTGNEVVRTRALVYSRDREHHLESPPELYVSRMIAIVSSDLHLLFTTTVEGGPTAAVSVVAFPSLSIKIDGHSQPQPVYVMAHSSDTGECPAGQCVLYASSSTAGNPKARLEGAISALINYFPSETSEESKDPRSRKHSKVLYSVYYEQKAGSSGNLSQGTTYGLEKSSVDLVFDDEVLDNVKDAWSTVMEIIAGDQVSQADFSASYMRFEERDHVGQEEDYGA